MCQIHLGLTPIAGYYFGEKVWISYLTRHGRYARAFSGLGLLQEIS